MNIAIRLPDSIDEIIYSFPFLHKLNELIDLTEDSIHLITASNEIAILNLLPFKAYFHELDKDDANSSIKVLRTFKNSRLPRLKYDLYFSTLESKENAILGLLLRAKNRVGFLDTSFNFLYNFKVKKLSGRSKVEQVYKLLNFIEQVDENNIENVASREFESNKEYEGYIVVDREVLDDDNWVDFLELIDSKKVIIYGGKFLDYNFVEKRNLIELSKLIYLSQGFITSNESHSLISSYVGTTCYAIHPKGNNYNYFLGKVFEFTQEDYPDLDKLNYGKVFDSIFEKLPSIIKDKQ